MRVTSKDTFLQSYDYHLKTNYWFADYFADMQLMQIIGDLFGAGTETTSNTLLWYVGIRVEKFGRNE